MLLHLSHKDRKRLKALMINTNADKNWVEDRERKREFKQTMIYLASKFKLCFVIGVVTI